MRGKYGNHFISLYVRVTCLEHGNMLLTFKERRNTFMLSISAQSITASKDLLQALARLAVFTTLPNESVKKVISNMASS